LTLRQQPQLVVLPAFFFMLLSSLGIAQLYAIYNNMHLYVSPVA